MTKDKVEKAEPKQSQPKELASESFSENDLLVSMVAPSGKLPTRANPDDAGFDLYAPYDEVIKPHAMATINTHIRVAIPKGYCGLICSRSGLAVKSGIVSHIGPGVIDSGYRGDLIVALRNESDKSFTIKANDRIAQMVLVPVFPGEACIVSKLPSSQRGDGGFGSSGK